MGRKTRPGTPSTWSNGVASARHSPGRLFGYKCNSNCNHVHVCLLRDAPGYTMHLKWIIWTILLILSCSGQRHQVFSFAVELQDIREDYDLHWHCVFLRSLLCLDRCSYPVSVWCAGRAWPKSPFLLGLSAHLKRWHVPVRTELVPQFIWILITWNPPSGLLWLYAEFVSGPWNFSVWKHIKLMYIYMYMY